MDAVREALANASLGQLEPIKNLPGMVRAAVGTLNKVWGANIELGQRENFPPKVLSACRSPVSAAQLV
jgi:hypothetical protein